MTENLDYCATIRVSADYEDKVPAEHIRRELVSKYMRDFFPSLVDDDKYHVMKFEMTREIRYGGIPEWQGGVPEIEYRLRCRHSIAQEQRVVIAQPDPSALVFPPYKVRSKFLRSAVWIAEKVDALFSRAAK
jgi:hypothetical protein